MGPSATPDCTPLPLVERPQRARRVPAPSVPPPARTAHVLGDDLTERERQVLGLQAAGRANRVIADETHLGVNTIRNSVSSILSKLGCHSKLEAVAVAIRPGIVDYP